MTDTAMDWIYSIRDLEWAAGFMEGEGSFCSSKGIIAQASQCNPDPLVRLHKMFGGRLWDRDPPKGKIIKSNYVIFTWACYGARARGVMMTLFELMSYDRQEQIKRALQNPSQQYHPKPTHCSKGHLLSEENLISRGVGRKRCKICHRVASREYYRRVLSNNPESFGY